MSDEKAFRNDWYSGGGGAPTTGGSAIPSPGGAVSSAEASDGGFVRRSAASMLSGKKPVAAAPAAKNAAPAKTGGGKKADGPGQTKKAAEPEDVEPSEMTLEEIESRIGSLIQVDTAKLKSTAWKECLEEITKLKEDIQASRNLTSQLRF